MPDTIGADGVLVVDKPVGPTSHDVVAEVRRSVDRKTGHTGTLDPGASGVLPLVIGRATRLASLLQAADKRYEVQLELGRSTDTYDWQGREIDRRPVPALQRANIEAALGGFRGTVEQTVPPFSAVRVGGERLYKAARRGEARVLPSRRVTISALGLKARAGDSLVLEITCSTGTYVRSLVHDLGERLGCGATVTALRRLAAGAFTIDQAIELQAVATCWQQALIPLEELLQQFPRIDLDGEQALRVAHGNPVPCEQKADRCRLFARGKLIAIGEGDGRIVRPKIVLRTD